MLFDAVIKIRRSSILAAILLACLGVVLLMCPEQYIETLVMFAGYVMIVFSLEQSLEFLNNKRSIMSYISFTLALVVGLVGLAVLVFNQDVLYTLCWAFGVLLIVDGGNTCYYALTFAKRASRPGWSILVILSTILILFGLLLIVGIIYFNHSVLASPLFLMKIIGCSVFFCAIVSAVRLLWILPVKEGGEANEKA